MLSAHPSPSRSLSSRLQLTKHANDSSQSPNPCSILYLHTFKVEPFDATQEKKHAFQVSSSSKTCVYATDTKHEVCALVIHTHWFPSRSPTLDRR